MRSATSTLLGLWCPCSLSSVPPPRPRSSRPFGLKLGQSESAVFPSINRLLFAGLYRRDLRASDTFRAYSVQDRV